MPAVAPRLVPLLDDDAASAIRPPKRSASSATKMRSAPLVAALDRPRRVGRRIARRAGRAFTAATREMFGGGAPHRRPGPRGDLAAGAQRLLDAAGARQRAVAARSFVIVLGWLRGPAVERALTHLLGTPAVHQRADRGDRPLRRADGRSADRAAARARISRHGRRPRSSRSAGSAIARAVPALIARCSSRRSRSAGVGRRRAGAARRRARVRAAAGAARRRRPAACGRRRSAR